MIMMMVLTLYADNDEHYDYDDALRKTDDY